MRTKKLFNIIDNLVKKWSILSVLLIAFLFCNFAYSEVNLLPNIGNYKAAMDERSKIKGSSKNQENDKTSDIKQKEQVKNGAEQTIVDEEKNIAALEKERKIKAKEVQKLRKVRARKLAQKKRLEKKEASRKTKKNAKLKKAKKNQNKIKIKKGNFYINNELFIVKGMGYSNCRPKELPTLKQIDLDQERKDFKIIRDAGFNTLRTWKPFSLEELNLAAEFGLYVIQGTWIEYRENFAELDGIKKTQETLAAMAKESLEASNVLMFLVGNEPQPRQVFSVGLENTNKFFRIIRNGLKKSAPKIPVSMSNWVQSDFLDDSMWDVAAVNIYIYNPDSVSHAMGYRGYANWMKRTRASKRPFVITEFGLSVSKKGVGNKGYGGNSLETQRDGVMYMYKEALAAGVNGACVFEWIDEWWKNFNHPSDQNVHEDSDPEEWFGVCYYDEKGELHERPSFKALKRYNQAICIEPKDGEYVSKSSFPVKVYVEDSIKNVSVKIGEKGAWKELKRKSDHWFNGKMSIKGIDDGKNTLFIKSMGAADKDIFENSKVIYFNKKRTMVTPYKVEIVLDKDTYYTKNKLSTVRIRFKVTDAKGNPAPGRKITASIYEPVLNQKLVLNFVSNEVGLATHFYNINEEGILTIAAGVVANSVDTFKKDQKYLSKNGDCKHIKIYYQEN